MYDRLHALYLAGSLTDAQLDNAVTKGWITAAQAAQIRADKAASLADPITPLITGALD